MQRISDAPTILLDVAHNPHSAEYLCSQVQRQYTDRNLHVVVAMLHDKDIAATLAVLAPITSHWYPASLTGPRAATAQEILEHLPQAETGFDTPVEAFEAALTAASREDVILVVGSFHTVGEVLEHWQTKGE